MFTPRRLWSVAQQLVYIIRGPCVEKVGMDSHKLAQLANDMWLSHVNSWTPTHQVTMMATSWCGGSGPLWSASTMSSVSACCSLSPGRPACPTRASPPCGGPTAFDASVLRSGERSHHSPGILLCLLHGHVPTFLALLRCSLCLKQVMLLYALEQQRALGRCKCGLMCCRM